MSDTLDRVKDIVVKLLNVDKVKTLAQRDAMLDIRSKKKYERI